MPILMGAASKRRLSNLRASQIQTVAAAGDGRRGAVLVSGAVIGPGTPSVAAGELRSSRLPVEHGQNRLEKFLWSKWLGQKGLETGVKHPRPIRLPEEGSHSDDRDTAASF